MREVQHGSCNNIRVFGCEKPFVVLSEFHFHVTGMGRVTHGGKSHIHEGLDLDHTMVALRMTLSRIKMICHSKIPCYDSGGWL